MRATPTRTQRGTQAAALSGALLGTLSAAACGPSEMGAAGFRSPTPSGKLSVIARTARERDLTAVPQLVEQLQSDDPAVRLAAIETLERLTGETHGYDYAGPAAEREAAVQRWVDAIAGERPAPPTGSEGRGSA